MSNRLGILLTALIVLTSCGCGGGTSNNGTAVSPAGTPPPFTATPAFVSDTVAVDHPTAVAVNSATK